jgi:hypothetical protein
VSVVVLPLKILFFPIVAVFAIVKIALLFTVGIALFAVFVAVIVPLVIVGLLVAVPVALIAVFT